MRPSKVSTFEAQVRPISLGFMPKYLFFFSLFLGTLAAAAAQSSAQLGSLFSTAARLKTAHFYHLDEEELTTQILQENLVVDSLLIARLTHMAAPLTTEESEGGLSIVSFSRSDLEASPEEQAFVEQLFSHYQWEDCELVSMAREGGDTFKLFAAPHAEDYNTIYLLYEDSKDLYLIRLRGYFFTTQWRLSLCTP